MDRIQQVQTMTRQREIPSAHVLIATLDRLLGRSDPLLTAVNLVDKILPVALANDGVVPKREHDNPLFCSSKILTHVFDLRAFAGTVQAGERNQQGTLRFGGVIAGLQLSGSWGNATCSLR